MFLYPDPCMLTVQLLKSANFGKLSAKLVYSVHASGTSFSKRFCKHSFDIPCMRT